MTPMDLYIYAMVYNFSLAWLHCNYYLGNNLYYIYIESSLISLNNFKSSNDIYSSGCTGIGKMFK